MDLVYVAERVPEQGESLDAISLGYFCAAILIGNEPKNAMAKP